MISLGIASIPARKEGLERVLDSLVGQVDEVFLALNYGVIEPPKYLDNYDNVFWWVNYTNKGDAEKFRFADKVDGMFISWDDDLLMYEGCVESMIYFATIYNAIVTFHGKIYDGERPIPNYKNSFTTNVRCLSSYREGDIQVHVGGTGCMAFDTNKFKLSIDDFEHRNMADVIVAREAYKQGVRIMALNHPALQYLKPPSKTTIWETTHNYEIQTNILNSFLK